jgi:2-iminobutanoate/2-iminopropanoate deaminase
VRTTVTTPLAPAAIGPYSQAVRAGNTLYCSGQIPLDPQTGQLVTGSIADETRRVLENLRAVIEAAGARMESIVRTTIYLTDLGTFAEVNRVYGEYFPSSPPARATVGVAALPRGARVEIDAIVALV